MNTQRKTFLALTASLAFAGGLAFPLLASAQATPQAAAAPQLPQGFKMLLNNDHVRVMESTFAPGVVYPMANYSKRTLYVVRGTAPIAYTYADGKTETLIQREGTSYVRDKERMSFTNTGTTDLVLLAVFDKRDLPPAPPAQ